MVHYVYNVYNVQMCAYRLAFSGLAQSRPLSRAHIIPTAHTESPHDLSPHATGDRSLSFCAMCVCPFRRFNRVVVPPVEVRPSVSAVRQSHRSVRHVCIALPDLVIIIGTGVLNTPSHHQPTFPPPPHLSWCKRAIIARVTYIQCVMCSGFSEHFNHHRVHQTAISVSAMISKPVI